MANMIEQRLKELSIELDEASVPAGSYVPYVVTNNLVFISGQLPFINGKLTIKALLSMVVPVTRFLILIDSKDEQITKSALSSPMYCNNSIIDSVLILFSLTFIIIITIP